VGLCKRQAEKFSVPDFHQFTVAALACHIQYIRQYMVAVCSPLQPLPAVMIWMKPHYPFTSS